MILKTKTKKTKKFFPLPSILLYRSLKAIISHLCHHFFPLNQVKTCWNWKRSLLIGQSSVKKVLLSLRKLQKNISNWLQYYRDIVPDLNMYVCIMLNTHICDVIKQNQSEVGNIDFKIEPNKIENAFCFLLFLASFKCSYLWNHLTNFNGVFCKM